MYARLYEEDGMEPMCRKQKKALFGIKDAAQNWEHAYIELLESVGLNCSVATLCTCHFVEEEFYVVAHGHDFTVVASAQRPD